MAQRASLSHVWLWAAFSLLAWVLASETQEPLIPEQSDESRVKKVAIIGAGSAGSSTAFYLSQYASTANIPIRTTVYERSSYVGGRSTTVDAFNDSAYPVELGASIFVEINRNLFSAAKQFGLVVAETEDEVADVVTAGPAYSIGIWDGKSFVYKQKEEGSSWWDYTKLFWRYGMAPITTQKLVKKTVDPFLHMYDAPHFPFESLSDVSLDLGLTQATAMTGQQYLESNGIGAKFANDVIQASTRVNYGQNLDTIHGLETMVCMSTDGAMSIKGGNWQIFERMLNASGAGVDLDTGVTGIARHENGTYTISSTSSSEDTEGQNEQLFDSVVLAAPFQYSKIGITPPLAREPDTIPYVKLHVTLFTTPHKLSQAYFGLPPDSSVPSMVLTTLPGPSPFTSISRHRTILRNGISHGLYKIFSKQPITADLLSQLYAFDLDDDLEPSSSISSIPAEHISWSYEKIWNSYPVLLPRVTFEEIKLDENLWYTSGIESFISTMETSSLMGMNVARLMIDGWEEKDAESFVEEDWVMLDAGSPHGAGMGDSEL